MKRTQLWTVTADPQGRLTAAPVDGVDSTETESKLEDLLVATPSLLSENLTLVGRQVPTAGGYIDLLGVDQDGRLVVYELKRGTLTREAVAQVLDYGSDLYGKDTDDVVRLIEENSGHLGIDEISDFLDWYDREYPNDRDPLSKPPRMVLVGLGVDDRARRMVDFLASSGLEIHLLTFHAFRQGDALLLARQVEGSSVRKPPPKSTRETKEGNRRVLLDMAASLGVRELLEEVADFLNARMDAYQWPGKTAYSFSLQSRTSEGRPTLHSYVVVYLNPKESGSLLFRLTQRAKKAAGDAISEFCAAVPATEKSEPGMFALELQITRETWPQYKKSIEKLLEAMLRGWKKSMDEAESSKRTEDMGPQD